MKQLPSPLPRLLLSAVLAGLCVAPAYAEKPEWAGKGKGHEKDVDRSGYFNDDRRSHVRGYYEDQFRRGHCPPGLAKKHNGCMPPGQAKKWRVGQPIPAGVAVYELPRALVIKLGTPPSGQKYVRVASDILLIAVGTRVIIDAVRDLGRV
jgi:Ni/Co efflux regulator RcnB